MNFAFVLILLLKTAYLEKTSVQFVMKLLFLKGKRLPNNISALKERMRLSNQFAANFANIYQDLKKLYAFEVSIISLIDAAIFVRL